LKDEKTEQYPWLVDESKTIITRDIDNEVYSETCNINRDFETTYSNIPLKAKEKYELNVGYKIFQSPTYTFPLYKGHKLFMEWEIVDTPKAAFDSLVVGSTLALSLLSLLSF